jgi:hypothetical protein
MKNLTRNLANTGTLKNSAKISVRISVAAAACLAFSACGAIAEKVTEEGAERLIEAESGEDVELDFDSGDGSFSLETEEGSFSFDEDGNFVVTDQDGSVFTGSASDDGLIVLDEDGEPVVNVSGDGENGEISIEGENGESVYRVVTDIPAEWPSDIPRPEGLTIEGGTYISADGETVITVIGTPSGSAIDYTESYLVAVAAAGLTETGSFDSTQDGSTTTQHTYENAEWTLSINSYQDGDSNIVNISILNNAG